MSDLPKKAMLLAAGRGERMRPLTDSIPKPLVCVAGCRLIEWHLKRLASCGVQSIVINHAHLGEKIVTALGDGSKYGLSICYSPEVKGGLETAGGIIQALPLLNVEEFIVVNADIWTDYNFSQLNARTLQNSLAHLVLVDTPSFKAKGDFYLDDSGLVSCNGGCDSNCDGQGKSLTFSGISLLSTSLFANWPLGRLALLPVLQQAIAEKKVSGEYFAGEWSDIGTIERLAALRSDLQH